MTSIEFFTQLLTKSAQNTANKSPSRQMISSMIEGLLPLLSNFFKKKYFKKSASIKKNKSAFITSKRQNHLFMHKASILFIFLIMRLDILTV